jgi:hypothetical protein
MRSQKFEELLFSFVMSLSVLLSAWNNSSLTGRILMKFDLEDFSKIWLENQVSLKFDKNNGTLDEDHVYLW